MREKYNDFIKEGSLQVLECSVLDLDVVYEDLDRFIIENQYNIGAVGYDPAYAKDFMARWEAENSPFGVVSVRQGFMTESVPLGELKIYAEERMLLFDEALMQFTMGNAITLIDTNGNRKLFKSRYDQKIDNVAAMMDAYVAYKANKDAFE
jgi:Phage terminase-like protein, large subunit